MNFKKILEEEGILPISKWSKFELNHIRPDSESERKNAYSLIKRNVSKQSRELFPGLYIYEYRGQIIYVGKAKSLFDRLKSHFRESFEEVPGDTKMNTWHNFFKMYPGKITIYWIIISTEIERQIIEKMLQEVLKPKFEDFRINFENRKKK